MLAVTSAVCTVIGLSACSAKFVGLRVDNAKTEFRVGDEFEYGEDFAVFAVYADGTEIDVTEEVQIKQEAGFDMDVAGDYQITVSWNGKKEIYTVYVSEFDNILRKIELDTDNVRKSYSLGEDVSFDGLKINCTYENAQGNLVESSTTSLKDFVVEIIGEDGYKVDDVYDRMGTYTVSVSIGIIKDSFTVTVDSINIDTVQGAIAAGKAFKDKVVSGTFVQWADKNNSDGDPVDYQVYDYEYEFGVDYTYIHEKFETPDNEYYYSLDENSNIVCVQFQGGNMVPNTLIQSGMIDGTQFLLWYNRLRVFGAENLLDTLYRAAKECSNNDLVQTADPVTRTYSFSFSGLVFISNANDYYENKVTFTLSEEYTVAHVEVEQSCWQDNSAQVANGAQPTFTTGDDGITVPNRRYSIRDRFTVEQVAGERTKTNPYSADALKIKSYDLIYNGQSLGDNGVIDCNIASPELTIDIANMLPTTANVAQDAMYFDYVGNYGSEVESSTLLYTEGFAAYRSGNKIYVVLKNGGVWTLKIRTSGTYKTVTFNVTGEAPTSITAQTGNETTGKFTSGSQKTVAIGGAVYFRGAFNKYANEAQTTVITSGNAGNATIEETTLGGVKCFVFRASVGGTYTVTVTSAVASSVKCTFTFVVSEMPDFETLLSGKYRAVDIIGDIYDVEFLPDAMSDGVSGSVVVTKTDTEDGSTQTQTLRYSVDFDTLAIVLTHYSGDNLGVDFKVNVNNQLQLEDMYGRTYTLNRVTE